MSKDTIVAFRAAAFVKEAAGTVVVMFAFITVFTLPFQKGLAQLSHI